MIRRIYERWFPRMWTEEWKELDAEDMSEISDELNIIADMLFNALAETYLENGEAEYFSGAKYRLEVAESYRVFNEVSELVGQVNQRIKTLNGKARDDLDERRIKAMGLPNKEAIAELKKMLAEVQAPDVETA